MLPLPLERSYVLPIPCPSAYSSKIVLSIRRDSTTIVILVHGTTPLEVSLKPLVVCSIYLGLHLNGIGTGYLFPWELYLAQRGLLVAEHLVSIKHLLKVICLKDITRILNTLDRASLDLVDARLFGRAAFGGDSFLAPCTTLGQSLTRGLIH